MNMLRHFLKDFMTFVPPSVATAARCNHYGGAAVLRGLCPADFSIA